MSRLSARNRAFTPSTPQRLTLRASYTLLLARSRNVLRSRKNFNEWVRHWRSFLAYIDLVSLLVMNKKQSFASEGCVCDCGEFDVFCARHSLAESFERAALSVTSSVVHGNTRKHCFVTKYGIVNVLIEKLNKPFNHVHVSNLYPLWIRIVLFVCINYFTSYLHESTQAIHRNSHQIPNSIAYCLLKREILPWLMNNLSVGLEDRVLEYNYSGI